MQNSQFIFSFLEQTNSISDLEISKPYFSSSIHGFSSFIAYPMPGSVSNKLEIKFKFSPSTMDQIAILMFIGQKGQHGFHSDHMVVSFVKGYIMLTWNLGSGMRKACCLCMFLIINIFLE